uniref:Uncharacterized protein n=1 Tax=Candidatus Kentrum sp. LPFa TaxID=2126335 RepID=A0A450WJV3_9GAMM|nr:MAG: hypothetical protein BECKLPF1236B_GA0070989_11147 [Candidatus Kentron sp. LPFa]
MTSGLFHHSRKKRRQRNDGTKLPRFDYLFLASLDAGDNMPSGILRREHRNHPLTLGDMLFISGMFFRLFIKLSGS